MSSKVDVMQDSEQKSLIIEHARLVAALASGNQDVKERLGQIEAKLNMSAPQIAHAAVDLYLKDY